MTFLLFFGAAVYLSGTGTAGWYIDIPSFVLVVIFPYILTTIIFPIHEQKKYFQAALGSNRFEESGSGEKALLFLKIFSRIAAGCTAVFIFFGVISIFAATKGNESNMLVPGIAITLLCPLYYSMLYVMVILPLRAMILKQENKR